MTFNVIPAIDIMNNRCVQLVGGSPETRIDYGNPVEKAKIWCKLGAKILHVVDLDAALGLGENFKTVVNIKEATGLPIHFGGGIRSVKAAENALNKLGHEDRIILGTLAVNDYPENKTLKHLNEKYGEDRVIVAVDSRHGLVSVKGWTEESKLRAVDLMEACEDQVWGFLYTDVDVEGRMHGIRAETVREIASGTGRPVIVAGGVSSKLDVEVVRDAGAWGVVLGKALYEDKISLSDFV
jgi:phosphoribosylformimino-5-aminoimidazole carboxamide ribotide isomerase